MKIIKETDSRYELLSQLWDKWNWNNIIIDKGHRIKYYIIPHELTLIPDYSYTCKFMNRELQKYNLTTQDYYDLVVLHINDTDDRPRCNYDGCNNYLNFTSISQGYCSCGSYQVDRLAFCCNEHQRLYHEVNNKLSLNSWMSASKRHKEYFKNHGNEFDPGYLYYTYLDNGKFKYGITCGSLESRRHNANRAGLGYGEMHILLESTRYILADTEYNIKLNFDGREYLEIDEVPKFIKVINSLGINHVVI